MQVLIDSLIAIVTRYPKLIHLVIFLTATLEASAPARFVAGSRLIASHQTSRQETAGLEAAVLLLTPSLDEQQTAPLRNSQPACRRNGAAPVGARPPTAGVPITPPPPPAPYQVTCSCSGGKVFPASAEKSSSLEQQRAASL